MIPPKEKYTIVGIGEVLWDIYRDHRYVGGAPANFAIHAAQLGDHGVLVSRVGEDGMGRELLAALRQRQLPAEFIQSDSKKMTGAVMVTLDVRGVPSFRCSHDVAFDYLHDTPELAALALRTDAVLFGTLAQRSPESRQTILRFMRAAKSAVRLFDVNSRPDFPLSHIKEDRGAEAVQKLVLESLAVANVVKMNGDELKLLQAIFYRTGDTPRKFIDFLFKKYALKLVAVTYGEAGCELFETSRSCKLDGWRLEARDTTGAGDAFAAGLIYQLLRGAPLQEISEFANLLGAFLCTQSGATPVFRFEDIEAFREAL